MQLNRRWLALALLCAGAVSLTRCASDSGTGPGGGSGGTVVPPGPTWSGQAQSVTVSEQANCLLDMSGNPWCWGSIRAIAFRIWDGWTSDYQRDSVCIANGDVDSLKGWPCQAFHPVRLATKAFTALHLSQWDAPLCGIDAAQAAWCWDQGAYLNVTADSTVAGLDWCGKYPCFYSPHPIALSALVKDFVSGQAACALTVAGAVYCAGSNAYYLLGTGYPIGYVSKSLVQIPSTMTFSQLAVGPAGDYACALGTDNKPYCWGYNLYGQAGVNSDSVRIKTPTAVASALPFSAIAVADRTACGLASGKAYCWGYGGSGELGWNGLGTSKVPVAVAGGHDFSAIVGGTTHFCALDLSGNAWCWGYDTFGQLGIDRGGTCSAVGVFCAMQPVAVHGGLTFTQIAAGTSQTCGVTTGHEVYCWGWTAYGRLGKVDLLTVFIGHPVKITP